MIAAPPVGRCEADETAADWWDGFVLRHAHLYTPATVEAAEQRRTERGVAHKEQREGSK